MIQQILSRELSWDILPPYFLAHTFKQSFVYRTFVMQVDFLLSRSLFTRYTHSQKLLHGCGWHKSDRSWASFSPKKIWFRICWIHFHLPNYAAKPINFFLQYMLPNWIHPSQPSTTCTPSYLHFRPPHSRHFHFVFAPFDDIFSLLFIGNNYQYVELSPWKSWANNTMHPWLGRHLSRPIFFSSSVAPAWLAVIIWVAIQ